MTYIVGVQNKECEISTIICDLMVTKGGRGNPEVTPTALKSVRLFPGCIVALAGDASSGITFLHQFKSLISLYDPPAYNWELFERYVSEGVHMNAEPFELLLSYNGTGIPELFTFHSKDTQLRKVADELVTIGSGKKLLDPFVKEKNNLVRDSLFDWMRKDKMPMRYYPYFLCLWLSELAQGLEFTELERLGVGGIFHFCFQEKKEEGRQLQSVYVISASVENKIVHYIYRISFSRGFLIFENPNLPGKYLLADSIEMPDLQSKSKEGLLSISRTAIKESDEMPFYRFCGFGFASKTFRNHFIIHIPKSPYSDEDLRVQRDGRIRPDILLEIGRIIENESSD
jgi:hypothetical protein